MICPYCNTELPDGLTYCPECGGRLTAKEPEEPFPRNASPLDRLMTMIASGVLALVLIASIVLVLIPKNQKDPSELFVDYDLEFNGYVSESCADLYSGLAYAIDLYGAENHKLLVSATLTNLTEKDVHPGCSRNDGEFPSYTFWYPEKDVKDSYLSIPMEWAFHDEDDVLYDNNYLDADDRLTLAPGDSGDLYLTTVYEPYDTLDLAECYVEARYNDESYYWDLELPMESYPTCKWPWEKDYPLTVDSFFIGDAATENLYPYGVYFTGICVNAYCTLTNATDEPIKPYAEDSILGCLRLGMPDEEHAGEFIVRWMNYVLYNENGLAIDRDENYELAPGESIRVLLMAGFDEDLKLDSADCCIVCNYGDWSRAQYYSLGTPLAAPYVLEWQWARDYDIVVDTHFIGSASTPNATVSTRKESGTRYNLYCTLTNNTSEALKPLNDYEKLPYFYLRYTNEFLNEVEYMGMERYFYNDAGELYTGYDEDFAVMPGASVHMLLSCLVEYDTVEEIISDEMLECGMQSQRVCRGLGEEISEPLALH